jgi:hypothetical protein
MDLMIRSVVLKAFPKSRRRSVPLYGAAIRTFTRGYRNSDANGYMSKYGTSFTKGAKMLLTVIEERRTMAPDDRPVRLSSSP